MKQWTERGRADRWWQRGEGWRSKQATIFYEAVEGVSVGLMWKGNGVGEGKESGSLRQIVISTAQFDVRVEEGADFIFEWWLFGGRGRVGLWP